MGRGSAIPTHSRNVLGISSMNIYSNPYTYLIGWTEQNTYYYGVRFAKDCHPNELWTEYFTSSKYVKKFRKKFGEPDVVQIRETFSDPDKARLWEHKVLRRIGAKDSEHFLNMTDNLSIKMTPEMYEEKFTPEVRAKMSESAKKRGFDQEQLSKARESIVYTEERSQKISKALKEKFKSGFSRSDQWRKRKSEATKKQVRTCEHCHLTVNCITYARWHGDRCKSIHI